MDLDHALRAYPWLGTITKKRPAQLRSVVEHVDGVEVRPDQPISFAERRFAPRRVTTSFIPTPAIPEEESCTSLV